MDDGAPEAPQGPDAQVTGSADTESKRAVHLADPTAASLDQLVDAARHGHHGAFEELVRRTHAETYTLARRLVSDDEDARDVVQEAYLRAYRSIGRFRGDAQFSTWMFRITANCAATHLGRRRRHRHDQLDDDAELADTRPEHDPDLAASATILRDRVELAIAELPPRLRAVVVLRDIYDLNHAQIAGELGISESAAKVRLHRARRRLRAQVFPDREGSGSEPEVEVQARAV